MNKMIMITTALLLAACDYNHGPVQKTGKEEAGQVAISCIEQMSACDDWKPVEMGDKTRIVKTEECPEYDSSDTYDFDGARRCRERNERREERNHEILSQPKHRSPCQQRIDSCVHMVEALVGAPSTVHHHEK